MAAGLRGEEPGPLVASECRKWHRARRNSWRKWRSPERKDWRNRWDET